MKLRAIINFNVRKLLKGYSKTIGSTRAIEVHRLKCSINLSSNRFGLGTLSGTDLFLHHSELRVHALEMEPEVAGPVKDLLEVPQGDFSELFWYR